MVSGANINQTSDFFFSLKTKTWILITSSVLKYNFHLCSAFLCVEFQVSSHEIHFIRVAQFDIAGTKSGLYTMMCSFPLWFCVLANYDGEIFQPDW